MNTTLRVMLAAVVVIAAVALAEQYDMHIAWLFAFATLGALFLVNPQTIAQIRLLIGG